MKKTRHLLKEFTARVVRREGQQRRIDCCDEVRQVPQWRYSSEDKGERDKCNTCGENQGKFLEANGREARRDRGGSEKVPVKQGSFCDPSLPLSLTLS